MKITTRIRKHSGNYISVYVEYDTLGQPYYSGTYHHSETMANISAGHNSKPYSFAYFTMHGKEYQLDIDEYLSPRRLCRYVKRWIEGLKLCNLVK